MLVGRMSDSRERAKARRLSELLKRYPLVIAFDSCLITLEVIRNLIREENDHGQVLVATGAKEQERKKVNHLFALGSKAKGVVALCSDAMSEGLNLQQASAVLLLDMPSVIRIAEQRVGRVDRMNSPHPEIEVWWPLDSGAFSLKADRKFFQRYNEVKDILGSNLPLPENLIPEELQAHAPATVEEMIQELHELERKGETWDGLRDAFQPVRELLEPVCGLVPEMVYRDVRGSRARVVSTVSLVRAERPWAFMAVAGAEQGAPKWVLIEGLQGRLVTHLEDVVTRLRHFLKDDPENRPMDKRASELIARFLHLVLKAEVSLLPRKKQRALEEMRQVLGHYLRQAEQAGDRERIAVLKGVLALQEVPLDDQERPDLDAVAEGWLDLIRETWYQKLIQRRRFKPLRLRDIRKELKSRPIPLGRIAEVFSSTPLSQPIHTRIIAAIVGLPDSAS